MAFGRSLIDIICGELKMWLFIVFGVLMQEVFGEEQKRKSTESKKTMGMIAGFGFIAAMAAILVTVWCCCCGNGCKQNILKVVPMEIQDPETRSTSPGSKGTESIRMERNESMEPN